MADFYENKQATEEVILVGVALGETSVTDESLDELEELAKTAGAVTVGRLIQNREMIHPGTYLGKGKLEELAFLISETHATGIICDDELSPAQMANMEDVLDIKVMDRTLLILDIFAQRATTREGKIQVELAQLRYRATRLVGMRNSLSRLGGGILTILAAHYIIPALPYLLSFAAGAMLYVVVEELIPEMSQGHHSDVGTLCFAVGFSLMMILDVALG